MKQWIIGINRSLEAVAKFFSEIGFTWSVARANMLLENMNNWLINQGLTLSEFLGHVVTSILFVVGFGVAVAGYGVGIGTLVAQGSNWQTYVFAYVGFGAFELVLVLMCRNAMFIPLRATFLALIVFMPIAGLFSIGNNMTDFASGMVLYGALVTLVGLFPFALLYAFSRKVFDLIFRTAEVSTEILAEVGGEGTWGKVPNKLKIQIQQMKHSASILPASPAVLLSCILAVFTLLYVIPNSYGFLFVLAVFAAATILITMRKEMGIKGHALKHFSYAAGVACFFGLLGYAFVGVLKTPKFIDLFGPSLMQFGFANQAEMLVGIEQLRFIFGALVALVSMPFLYLTTRSVGSDNDWDNGDVVRKSYAVHAVGLDAHGKPIRMVVPETAEPGSLGDAFLNSLLLLAALTFVWAVLVKVFGMPDPFSRFEMYQIALILAFGFAAVFALFATTVGEDKTTTTKITVAKEAHGDHH